MWNLKICLLVVATLTALTKAQDDQVKHNLPDNVELIDPKSLGLSDADVEKFLGNVKLLPVGGEMGNNVKTQILTVGFEGDEKLDLADLQGFSTAGLGGKDKEVAEQAFKSFKQFFKKPDNSVDFDKAAQESEKPGFPTTFNTRGPSDSTTPAYSSSESGEYRGEEERRTTVQVPFGTRTTPLGVSGGASATGSSPPPQFNTEELTNLLKVGNGQKLGGFLNSNTGSTNRPEVRFVTQEQFEQEQRNNQNQQNQVRFVTQEQYEQEQRNNNNNQQQQQQNHQPNGPQQQGQQSQQHEHHQGPQHQNQQQQHEIQQGPQYQHQQQHHEQNQGPQHQNQQQQHQQKQNFEHQNHQQNFPGPIQSTQQPQHIQIPINQPAQNFVPPNHNFGGQMIVGAPLLVGPPQPGPVFVGPSGPPPPVPHHHQPVMVPVPAVQQFNIEQRVPFEQPQQQQQQPSFQTGPPPPNHQFQQGPQQQFTQQPPVSNGPQQQNFPPASPIHSQNFQPPEKFTRNFIPVHGPQAQAPGPVHHQQHQQQTQQHHHHQQPSTPRPGFDVTPSMPMIPLSTVENAINRPPVVPQHLHHNNNNNQQSPLQQHHDLRNGNKHTADQIAHQDIVAQIAREQHLRIAQQPAQVATHPPAKNGNQQQQVPQQGPQHQNRPQHGRELSQEPVKVQHLFLNQPQQQPQQQFSSRPPFPPQQQPQQQNFNNQPRFPNSNSAPAQFNQAPPSRPQQQQPQHFSSPPRPQFTQAPPRAPQQFNNNNNQQRPQHQNFNQPPQQPQQNRPNQYTPQFGPPNFPAPNRFTTTPVNRPPPSTNNNNFGSNANRPLPPPQPQPTRTSHVFFPPARQNTVFNGQNNRFPNNRPPPPPPHRPTAQNPGFVNQNLVHVDQPHLKSPSNPPAHRFPAQRPDPSSFTTPQVGRPHVVHPSTSFPPPPPLRGQVPPAPGPAPHFSNNFDRPTPSHDESIRGPRHFANFGFGPNPYHQGPPASFTRGPPPPGYFRDLNVDGSEHRPVFKALVKPNFIHSIQPSKMVSYQYYGSDEN